MCLVQDCRQNVEVIIDDDTNETSLGCCATASSYFVHQPVAVAFENLKINKLDIQNWSV